MTHENLRINGIPDDIYQRVCQRWDRGEKRALSQDDQTRLEILDPSGQLLTNLILAWEKQKMRGTG